MRALRSCKMTRDNVQRNGQPCDRMSLSISIATCHSRRCWGGAERTVARTWCPPSRSCHTISEPRNPPAPETKAKYVLTCFIDRISSRLASRVRDEATILFLFLNDQKILFLVIKLVCRFVLQSPSSTPNGAELTLLFVPARIRSRARQKGWGPFSNWYKSREGGTRTRPIRVTPPGGGLVGAHMCCLGFRV